MKASRLIVETLRSSGSGVFFGLPGVHALGLWAAMEEADVQYIGFRHEQAAAHAADGFGRATGNPGVVALSTGPGALNAASALAEANVSSSPLLAIASNIPSSQVGSGKGYLHEGADHGSAFGAVTRRFERATTPEEISPALRSALGAAVGGRQGAAMLEIPADLFDAEVTQSAQPVTARRPTPDSSLVEEAARLLSLAARPVVWAGGGVLRSGASEALVAVAEALDAPVVTTFMGKGAIPEGHPLAIGTMIRMPETERLLAEADAMLAVGTRFSGMSTANHKMELPAQLVHIDIDPDEVGRNYPVRYGIAADADAALTAIREALSERGDRGGRDRAASVRGAAFERARNEGPKEVEMLEALRRAIDPETPVVHDMCVPSYWSWPFLETTVPNTSHAPYGYGSLGFAFPAAIGMAAGLDRPVVAFCGDGGFQYHLRELATVAEHSLPVVSLVFNDRAWGILRSFSRARYSSDFGMDLPGPDFVALARAYGVEATSATDPEALEKAVRRAFESGGPQVVEVPGSWEPPPPAAYYRR